MSLMLLDLDDTLVRRQAVFAGWAEEFASHYPEDPDLVAWLTAQDRDGWRPRDQLWSLIKKRLKLHESVAQLVADWEQIFITRYELEPEARAGLTEARSRGWRLGVVTNGDASVQAAKAAAAGLAEFVDVVCISGAEGIQKPDRRIFELAAERCGSSLAGGWMIGDNPVADIQGAYNAGLDSVWVTGTVEAWPADLRPPTHSAATVSAAVDLVLSLPTQELLRS